MENLEKNKKLSLILKGIAIIAIFIAGLLGGSFFDSFKSDELPSVTDNFESKMHFVTEVIDGDTITVDGSRRIRLIAVDAPESDECYYTEAKDALKQLVEGEYVRLEKDNSVYDDFGRTLCYVFLPQGELLDNVFANNYLLEQGFANVLPASHNRKYWDILVYSRNQAVSQKRGMWADCEQELEEETSTFEADDSPPNPECLIKGNISEHGYGKTYFPPGCANYKRVKVDLKKGDRYFCTEEEAQAAGFKKAESCDQVFGM